ncbi:MAG: GDSL-type esterase/lipase family protein [Clostridium sp.]|jgi:lysophospholipase L1-like esterase|uniref:GDSL-type esterase/lipase family protein n=1 Tax=Clostridium sp. TaxID=1506 RepID=UPI0025B7F610|nr:GDSL-type esterase/lipase family protein [Clostridium sp.]MCH3964655.1 GDSL-type esterase/lipase family protein [Clostridium sp.]MCI1715126.1 GDSL-type esterase/lipase family protein [Clostridium sp.]MCI1799388.1 GDSL-type esterase/lipase family protein [Clostridium sp.]MCI1813309.1 GDSL-type esterase/lipase family protein [Clostridium sp.]MCI1870200.1 GDSL-type esterase/lipase family protein [Clostridium sp.]
MKLVCIGDSLTTGYGVFTENSWIYKLKDALKIEIINKGVNGDTTAGMLSRSFSDVVGLKPNFVFIMGGCNDIMCLHPLKNIEDNFSELVREAVKYSIVPIAGIEPPVIGSLASIHWANDLNYTEVNNIQQQYRNWLIDYCSQNRIEYIDFFELFSEELKYTEPEKLFIDGIHPSPLGHSIMADMAVSKMLSILARIR